MWKYMLTLSCTDTLYQQQVEDLNTKYQDGIVFTIS